MGYIFRLSIKFNYLITLVKESCDWIWR